MEWILSMIKKHREVVLYLVFGVLTTLVNILVYFILADVLGIYYLAGNAAAWVLSVLFAYVTNRTYVFQSKASGAAAVARELILFVGCRLLSGAFDMGCMYLCVDVLRMDGMLAKIISNVIVVILNYLFSKLLIFRKKRG